MIRSISICVLLLLAACCPTAPENRVIYRIPPEKQADAAKLTAQIVESLKYKSYSPESIASSAYQQALAIYGEPVKP